MLFTLSFQKAFHEDVVMVLVERLRKEEYLPVEQRPTSQAKLYYIKVMFFLSFCRSTIAAGVQFSCYWIF